jgi:sortase A
MGLRGLVSLFGTVLVAVGAGGFALLLALPVLPPVAVEPVAALILAETPRMPDVARAPATPPGVDLTRLAITRLSIESIELDTPVVPAALVEHESRSTWDVPKFVAGHAEGTPGAGEPGNAILIGHVASLTLGHVFEHLNGVRTGDTVHVYGGDGGDRLFEYRVVDVRNVGRLDVSVLEPTPTPTLTMITCTGLWLPIIWDYTERLVVRAESVP